MPTDFIEEAAATVFEMMRGGHHDPHVEEIIEAHSGPITPATNIPFWRDQLAKIRDVLAKRPVTATCHLVAPAYYEDESLGDVDTIAKARQCVATSCKPIGLRIGTQDDLMWQAVQAHNAKAGASKTSKAIQRAYDSVVMKKMSNDQLAEVIEEAQEIIRVAYTANKLLERRGVSRVPLFDAVDDSPGGAGNLPAPNE
jgi:hypothetical protein